MLTIQDFTYLLTPNSAVFDEGAWERRLGFCNETLESVPFNNCKVGDEQGASIKNESPFRGPYRRVSPTLITFPVDSPSQGTPLSSNVPRTADSFLFEYNFEKEIGKIFIFPFFILFRPIIFHAISIGCAAAAAAAASPRPVQLRWWQSSGIRGFRRYMIAGGPGHDHPTSTLRRTKVGRLVQREIHTLPRELGIYLDPELRKKPIAQA